MDSWIYPNQKKSEVSLFKQYLCRFGTNKIVLYFSLSVHSYVEKYFRLNFYSYKAF